MESPQKDPYDFPTSPPMTRDAMRPATPIKEDSLAHREKPDTTNASPGVRPGTPKAGTHVATPRTGTPHGASKHGTPKTTAPAEKKAITEDAPNEDDPEEHDEPKPNGDKAQPNGDVSQRIDPGYKEDVEIDSFISHRIDEANSTVDIRVLWEGGETTWETEWSLQEQVPALVFQYWDKLGGRDAATKLEVYHVFKILRRDTSSRAKKYEVQWVGFKRNDSTVEKEDFLRSIAPAELDKFQAKELASGASNDKRKGAARGPGRPRKKARADED
ncbi:unnamed protein product [Fusarium graminearum]|uniref:Chromosome 1, complete genome n=2 Tax=Gibberella zeae (strain ATCC MYA-4620 / CBS 123657 / FGSC 9075 / NRRL 31084 / PH-1) TaxID=229533 RepID=A0A1C3YJ34_GIBZE|nr:unnamed protein product [Fusarium graminearum]